MKATRKLTPEEIQRNGESLLRILNAKQEAKRKLALIRQTKNYKDDIIMLTKEDAIKIAKSIVPDIEDRIFNVTLEKPRRAMIYGGIPDDCWYITYSPFPRSSKIFYLCSSQGIFVNKFTGKLIFHGSLRDEG